MTLAQLSDEEHGFPTKFHPVLPTEEELRKEIERERDAIEAAHSMEEMNDTVL